MVSQCVRQRHRQIPRITAASLAGELECEVRIAARALVDPRKHGAGERPPGSFMEHLVQGAKAKRPHPHLLDTARIWQPEPGLPAAAFPGPQRSDDPDR